MKSFCIIFSQFINRRFMLEIEELVKVVQEIVKVISNVIDKIFELF